MNCCCYSSGSSCSSTTITRTRTTTQQRRTAIAWGRKEVTHTIKISKEILKLGRVDQIISYITARNILLYNALNPKFPIALKDINNNHNNIDPLQKETKGPRYRSSLAKPRGQPTW